MLLRVVAAEMGAVVRQPFLRRLEVQAVPH
jgi:hypothetical protein